MTFVAGALAGKPVRRVEDESLLRGRGTYVANTRAESELQALFVRSPFARADIRSIDTIEAEEMPGVVAVYTADSLDLPGWVGLVQLHSDVSRPPLAKGRVNFVGDMVAVVVAETTSQAVDAAEMVQVDYEPLTAVTDMEAALESGAPIQFEAVTGNLVQGTRDPMGTSVLNGADVVVRGRFENQRVAVVPMEGSSVLAMPGHADDRYDLTLNLACQMPHGTKAMLAGLLGISADRIRVVAPDVGGAFGAKHLNPESVVVVKAALVLGRPVRWVETRSENLVSMPHGRGQVQYIELGLRSDGMIVGMRCRIVGDAGAYAGFGGILPGMMTRTMASGVYRIPAISFDVAVALTNTTPMGAYRGAGRPEAAAFVERIMDMAADELGLDPAELRRRNLIRPTDFPYTTVMGTTYDSGNYELALNEAMRLADYSKLRLEQEERRERGDRMQLGIGLSMYVEITGSAGGEFASVSISTDGRATVLAGTSAHGQGHATTFSMLVADRLKIPLEDVIYIQSDTALVPRGGGTGGSRSLQLGGTAVAEAADLAADRGRSIAANMFEASPDDIIQAADGTFSVAGVPARSVTWGEISAAANESGQPLIVEHDSEQSAATFPFGSHVSVVEVDTETGQVTPLRHIAVDDCGRILNPLLVDGQVHGGLASGISQALWEQFVYDTDGNPITTTLAEYALPSAAELITFELAHTEVASPLNSIGAKGIGESATVGSTPAVQNAVVDALSHLGVRHLDMPLTAERVWRAISDAQNGRPPASWREAPAVFDALPFAATAAEEEANDFNL
jgi:aerobic carbon-monoxide dehydrogenase large subunit